MMYLLPFWALKISVALLSIHGSETLRFHHKYVHLCSKDERRSYGFGTTWHFWVNCPFKCFSLIANENFTEALLGNWLR